MDWPAPATQPWREPGWLQIPSTLLSSEHSLFFPSFLPQRCLLYISSGRSLSMDYCFPVFLVALFPLCPCSLPGKLVNCLILVSVCIRTSGSLGFAENHLLYHICCILVWEVGVRLVLHVLTSQFLYFFYFSSLLILLFLSVTLSPKHFSGFSRSVCYEDVCVLPCKTGLVLCC